MNYRILWEKNKVMLEQRINEVCDKEGFKLAGGVSISTINSKDRTGKDAQSIVFAQSVYKE